MGFHEALMTRFNFFGGMLGLGIKRDLYKVFGYSVNPTFTDHFRKYLRQDVAARVVDAPAAALWTNPPRITSNDSNWDTAWNDLTARHDLWAHIERCDRLAGIGRYAILIIGFNDGQKLDQPVDKRRLDRNKQKILYLQPYSEPSAQIESYNTDSTSDRFMMPEFYLVNPNMEQVMGFQTGKGTKQTKLGSFRVHASRVIHIAENILENSVYGSPRLERVYNILDDLMKVTGGSAETYWLTSNRGMHVDVDKEMEMDAQDAKDLSAELEEYTNGLRRIIRTRGVKVDSLGGNVADPKNTFGVLVATLSGATGIPQRILIGSEAGQLASEQDRANWADRIDERRANFGNPTVLHQLIKMLTYAGYLPNPESLNIIIQWPSAFKMSPLEAAQTSAQHARSATNFAKTFETMLKITRGEPGTPDTTDANGNTIPGTPAIEPVDLGGDLVTIEEARKMIGLDKPPVTFDSGSDVGAVDSASPSPASGSIVVPKKRRNK